MVSSVTEAEAGITGVRHIPQCSCASASVDLSDKSAYPYFFRTVGDVVLYGRSLVDWVQHMGWNMFALIYTNDNVGQQGSSHDFLTLHALHPQQPLTDGSRSSSIIRHGVQSAGVWNSSHDPDSTL